MTEKKITYGTTKALVYCLKREAGEPFVIHNYDHAEEFPPVTQCYILPFDSKKGYPSYRVTGELPFEIRFNEDETEVSVVSDCPWGLEDGGEMISPIPGEPVWNVYDGLPDCDLEGNSITLDFEHGEQLRKTFYHFYWETLLPSVVERTRAVSYPVSDGYVVSTLQEGAYAGTYPDVDHEFQIKGRLAMAGETELSIVRRMMELQLKMMEEDPEGAYRDPCAVQPDGTREYHVRRSSMDGRENAEMFLMTGNIEIIEAAWYYYAASKDRDWLERNVEGLEHALSLVESCIDSRGRLWSDVYYEDQVIKDGRECMAGALAARSFELMAQLESLLERRDQETHYRETAKKLGEALGKASPIGFWEESKGRFIDWIDRNSVVHDHIHLLANELPVLFRYADEEQVQGVERLMETYFGEFQRFPSFVAARIEDYTDSEIGSGGPYDLCAAGRYWCWDFAYWKDRGRSDILEQQLLTVCRQAKLDGYRMGERYDMNHVYYISDYNWHGAAHYYEYPCVFIWNLISGYLGISFTPEADLRIEPMVNREGRVRLDSPRYGIEYEIRGNELVVTNLLAGERTYLINWRWREQLVTLKGGESCSIKGA